MSVDIVEITPEATRRSNDCSVVAPLLSSGVKRQRICSQLTGYGFIFHYTVIDHKYYKFGSLRKLKIVKSARLLKITSFINF